MSTDDPNATPDRPMTRAEARALRAAAEAAAAATPDRGEAGGSTPSRPASAEPASGSASAGPETAAEPERGVESLPGAAPDPAPVADPSSVPAPASAAEPRPEPEPEPVGQRPGRRRRDDPARSYPGFGEGGEGDPGRPRPSRRFGLLLGGVVAVLALVVAGLSALSLTQGPRVSAAKIDPAVAIGSSGARLVLTANEPLAAVDPSQVTVEPAVPFTVDTAGRGVGIRFTVPLDDQTEYTVQVRDVHGVQGGPTGTLHASFRTPSSQIFLLQRTADGDDTIFHTDLTGEKAVPVFRHAQISDFRATADRLVVATEQDGQSQLLVMDRDGGNQHPLPLPAEGFISMLQVSDRGGLVGYTFTDKKLDATSGRASVLVTQSIRGDDKPVVEMVGDRMPSTADWYFVPDSAAVLFIDFTGALYVDDLSGDAGPTSLGLARSIQGVSRGTYTAVVERATGLVDLDLANGSEKPLAASTPDMGFPTAIVPYPGGTLRHIVSRNAAGLPNGQSIVRVGDDGAATTLFSVPAGDSIMQFCPSPSGQYTAVVVAPNLVDNPYDRSLLPLPETLQTHLLDTRTGKEKVVLTGFDASWCSMGPRR